VPPFITLTTDFGRDSSYVAAMKGVILSINPAAVIVDISHAVAPQSITEGAFVLGESTRWFPRDSIHVAVVDPGVGTDRKIVYARIDDQQYVCPDNGLLSYVCRHRRPEHAIELTNRSLFLAEVSNTFHGRDIMAPVAAQLSLGLPPEQLGPKLETLKLFEWPQPQRRDNSEVGRILYADSFGNLISNVSREDLPGEIEDSCFRVETAQHQLDGIAKTYCQSSPGTVVALFGSSGLLELAVVQGNAAARLQIPIGESLIVKW
jgi:S-adenosyl-L-methionine hydrolase (adenosine-forming)